VGANVEGACVVGANVEGACVVGANVEGATVEGTVEGADEGNVAIVVVGGVLASSSSNTKITRSSAATAMIVHTTITAVRCHPCQVESSSASSVRGGGVGPDGGRPLDVGPVDMRPRSLRRGPRQTDRVRLAPARLLWIVVPLTAGPAASHALGDWTAAPRVVAITFLWLAWGAGVVALLAPRPAGLTVVRIVAPAFFVLAVVAALTDDATTAAALGAVVGTGLAAAAVADPHVALASANGIAYGDERRHPLRTPPALYLAPLPVARALAAAGPVAGPVLLADGEVVWGVVALVIGLPVAVLAFRSLQVLVHRWLVVVPAGLVVADPMTLSDPVLVARRQLRGVRGRAGTAPPGPGSVDLRLGATLGTVEIVLDGTLDVVRRGRRHRPDDTLRPASIVVAVAARDQLLARAAARVRARQAAMPPPSSASPA
jgi:hypothetical protein